MNQRYQHTYPKVYLDYQATTPVDSSVLAAMLPYFSEHFGNAHSTNHAFGWAAESAVERARSQIAHSIGAKPEEILFTSGATESINTALCGIVGAAKAKVPHVVSVRTEHKAALATLEKLQSLGCRITLLEVDSDGLIQSEQVDDALTDDTVLVSVMAVNNEIGVIQPIQPIALLCDKKKITFHTDLAQAIGRIPINVSRSRIGLASISGHKIYGPKGVGVLYCQQDLQHSIRPLIAGGGQERGLRSGTLPVPLVVGMGEAAELVSRKRISETKRLSEVRDAFLSQLQLAVPDIVVHGSMDRRVPANLNLAFPGIDAEALINAMPMVAVSLGSACTSAAPEPSHVLKALGLDYEIIMSSMRIGFGAATSLEDALFSADHIGEAVRRLRIAA